MALSLDNLNFEVYVVYVAEHGQQVSLPLFFGTSTGMQPAQPSPSAPIFLLTSQGSTAFQPQSHAFIQTKGNPGPPLPAVYTNYTQPWVQAQQPFGAQFLSRETSADAVSMGPFLPEGGLSSAKKIPYVVPEGENTNPVLSKLKNFLAENNRDMDKSGKRFEEILSVRNFSSPVGSVLVPGRKMHMNVPPLARRRPPLCRNPLYVSVPTVDPSALLCTDREDIFPHSIFNRLL